jgi:hypothetical protein
LAAQKKFLSVPHSECGSSNCGRLEGKIADDIMRKSRDIGTDSQLFARAATQHEGYNGPLRSGVGRRGIGNWPRTSRTTRTGTRMGCSPRLFQSLEQRVPATSAPAHRLKKSPKTRQSSREFVVVS